MTLISADRAERTLTRLLRSPRFRQELLLLLLVLLLLWLLL